MTELEVVREEIKHLITAIRAHAEVAREFPRFRVRYYFKNVPKVTLDMEDVVREVADCRRCPLHKGRTHIVFGEGNTKAKLVFVGEAPGADEDRLGRPFVGKAGQLLTRIIEAMGMRREDVYICNVLKCRPPGNRTPLPQEMEVCGPFLEKQLEVIKPTVICALGSIAAKALLKTEAPITALRGRFHDYRGIPCLPTFHPAYLLRNPAAKKQVWQDMKLIMERLGI
ncbi:MAG: uracil-DNA glycosylase [Syntrophales bacterium]|nr:uracil-DNA glycosylase [Syntrophales bacterium]